MNEEEGAALALLSRMRFACGDNGKRMQDELEVYLRELRRDAERYRWLRDCDSDGEDKVMLRGGYLIQDELLSGKDLDEAIDAAMADANDVLSRAAAWCNRSQFVTSCGNVAEAMKRRRLE